MVIDPPMGIRTVPVVEAKVRYSALMAGMEARITRRGRTVARLVPEPVSQAASLSEPFCADAPPNEVDSQDSPPEPAPDLG